MIAGGGAPLMAGMGNRTAAGVQYGVISGGSDNAVSENYAVVGGGSANWASGGWSIISGGEGNSASNYFSTVAGGTNNSAEGISSFVGGGVGNVASGDASVAMGEDAIADGNHSFVFSDGSAFGSFGNAADGEFAVLASGGVRFVTDADTNVGVQLSGGTWTSFSDRNAKKNLEAVDAEAVLRAVAQMPIWRWSYKTQSDAVRHMGPTAQDFRVAFGLGEHDTSIGVIDADGVNLAAVQALEKRTAKLQEQNLTLTAEIDKLRAQQQQLMQRLEELLRDRR